MEKDFSKNWEAEIVQMVDDRRYYINIPLNKRASIPVILQINYCNYLLQNRTLLWVTFNRTTFRIKNVVFNLKIWPWRYARGNVSAKCNLFRSWQGETSKSFRIAVQRAKVMYDDLYLSFSPSNSIMILNLTLIIFFKLILKFDFSHFLSLKWENESF